ncbi:uncharacterized protein LOC110550707 isoform X3 [Meriones unguiculatus]|uniref:uncharacterized protein LOC110550707 isoform X3 n=1 Tax=Meriones unguiculatus TaxID=10047 RepID=UPI00293ECB0D|nr:uncharacterized protein LOC110550707 isoform X3 [Meriones unguiculatus]
MPLRAPRAVPLARVSENACWQSRQYPPPECSGSRRWPCGGCSTGGGCRIPRRAAALRSCEQSALAQQRRGRVPSGRSRGGAPSRAAGVGARRWHSPRRPRPAHNAGRRRARGARGDSRWKERLWKSGTTETRAVGPVTGNWRGGKMLA